MINPHKPKYHSLYWDMAKAAAAQSVATRHQVGAIVVTPTGMISVGWNGMPSGMVNDCERGPAVIDYENGGIRYKTSPEVIHAERNALDKMARQGVPTDGSILFVTRAPCLECAKSLSGLGLKVIYYGEQHDDMRGVEMLKQCGIKVCHAYDKTPKPDNLHKPSGLSAV